ncbi:MAG: hypothetical protein ACTH2X_10215 [Brachybacterium tyrofermentans]
MSTTEPANAPDAYALAITLHEFARTWTTGMLTDDLSGKLTCSELDALADLLTAIGEESAAQAWTASHALHDEDGDTHYTP